MRFQGVRPNFEVGGKFDRFLAARLAEVRAPGGPARLVFRDPGDNNLTLVVGRRGAAFYFKGASRIGDDGKRVDQSVMIGKTSQIDIAAARKRAAELRQQQIDGGVVSGARAHRRAIRESAADAESESERRRGVIENICLRATATPGPAEIALLRYATLAQSGDAYILHGFPRETTDRRRKDISAHIKLAIIESGCANALPAALDAAAISHLARNHSASTGRKRVEALRRLYRWLILYKAADVNPALEITDLPAPPVRERYATADELRRIWISADKLTPERSDFLKLLILLPLRRGELAELRVREITTNNGIFQLEVPKLKAKNKQKHVLPLTGEAATIIRRRIANLQPDDRVVQLASGGRPFSGWTTFKNQIKAASGCDWFYFHQSRKLFLTELIEHESDDPALIDACLNHSKSSIFANYDFAQRARRRLAILSAWDRIVAQTVNSGVFPRHASKDNQNVIVEFRA